MRDATFFEFIKDYNEFKKVMSSHLGMTDFRDYETYMYTRSLYNLLIKIPLFKIFFNHQLAKMGKKNREKMAKAAAIQRARMEELKAQEKASEFKEKIAI